MNTTTVGVSNLTDHMMVKYGIPLAMVLLSQQYGYTFRYRKKDRELIVTDNNKASEFYGNTYKLIVSISNEELKGLEKILG